MTEFIWTMIKEVLETMNEQELEAVADVFLDVYERIPSEELTEGFSIEEYTEDHHEILGVICKGITEIVRKRSMVTAK